MGFRQDIITAKIESAKILNPEFQAAVDDSEHIQHKAVMRTLRAFDKEAELTTQAFKNLLSHPDFLFRVTDLKASVKLHTLKINEDLKADIDMDRVVEEKVSQVTSAKSFVDIIVGWFEGIKDVEIAGVKPLSPILSPLLSLYNNAVNQIKQQVVKTIPQTEGKNNITMKAFEFREDGSEDGGYLETYGHAYIGNSDPIPLSDTATEPEDNDFTEVRYIKEDDEDTAEYWDNGDRV
tara:strand:+ start:131 stop:838 length:708 start_codon:yes stop_codon:yes gene_type:complete